LKAEVDALQAKVDALRSGQSSAQGEAARVPQPKTPRAKTPRP